MSDYRAGTFDKYIEYIRNCGSTVSVSRFRDDWEPIGRQIMLEMKALGLIKITTSWEVVLVEEVQ